MARRTFPAVAASVPAARRFATEAVAHLPGQLGQTVAVLVSELATNAVRHAGGSPFAVDVDAADGRLWVGITDTGTGQPIPRSPAITDEHGRGLHLVAALADRWGAHRRRDTGAKTVWFELTVLPDRPDESGTGTHPGVLPA
ncbi:ATP-binding protein [Geodermatophilus sp. SYSU D01062]